MLYHYDIEIKAMLWKAGFKTEIEGIWKNKPYPFIDVQDEIPATKGYVVISTEAWEDYYHGDKLIALLENFTIKSSDSHPLRTLYTAIKPAMVSQ